MRSQKQKYLSCTIFVVFFIILMIQHSFVYMYFDDYGYASLSMVNNIPDVSGTHFNFIQFYEYYKLHYLTVTGRIFFQSFMTLSMAAGIWCIRIVQCIFITLTLILIYKIIQRYSNLKPSFIAITVCCLYGLMEIFLMDKSIYWFTIFSYLSMAPGSNVVRLLISITAMRWNTKLSVQRLKSLQ